jgi:hypothetical protein
VAPPTQIHRVENFKQALSPSGCSRTPIKGKFLPNMVFRPEILFGVPPSCIQEENNFLLSGKKKILLEISVETFQIR